MVYANALLVETRDYLTEKVYRQIEAKDMWAAVTQLTGHRQVPVAIEGISAQSFNEHYASISTDPDYITPRRKYSACPSSSDYISEWRVFCALDHLCPSATGPDELPAWFLRLGAPLFYKPVVHRFSGSGANYSPPPHNSPPYRKPVCNSHFC